MHRNIVRQKLLSKNGTFGFWLKEKSAKKYMPLTDTPKKK